MLLKSVDCKQSAHPFNYRVNYRSCCKEASINYMWAPLLGWRREGELEQSHHLLACCESQGWRRLRGLVPRAPGLRVGSSWGESLASPLDAEERVSPALWICVCAGLSQLWLADRQLQGWVWFDCPCERRSGLASLSGPECRRPLDNCRGRIVYLILPAAWRSLTRGLGLGLW